MEAIVIRPRNKNDIKFWLDLAKKTGTKAKSVNLEELEDFALSALIEEGLNTEDVDRDTIMKELGK